MHEGDEPSALKLKAAASRILAALSSGLRMFVEIVGVLLGRFETAVVLFTVKASLGFRGFPESGQVFHNSWRTEAQEPNRMVDYSVFMRRNPCAPLNIKNDRRRVWVARLEAIVVAAL